MTNACLCCIATMFSTDSHTHDHELSLGDEHELFYIVH